MKTLVQITDKKWEGPTIFWFDVDFEVLPYKGNLLKIEYKDKIIKAEVYDIIHEFKVEPDISTNTSPKITIQASFIKN